MVRRISWAVSSAFDPGSWKTARVRTRPVRVAVDVVILGPSSTNGLFFFFGSVVTTSLR